MVKKHVLLYKMLVVGIILLFLGITVQPSTSIGILINKKADSNIDEDCDCSHVTNSGKPICDKIQQWIYTFNQKLEIIVELLEQYKHNPILTRLYILQALFLMGRVVHFQSYWFLLGCNS